MTDDVDPTTTPITDLYPGHALEIARRKISDQALWLLLSLDQYGWRAEHDLAVRILDVDPHAEPSVRAHARLAATTQMFQAVDKLWRLAFAIRRHRAGFEFLGSDGGYLTYGHNLAAQLDELKAIDEAGWIDLLGIPDEETIRRHLSDGAPEELKHRIEVARGLPSDFVKLLATLRSDLMDREPTFQGMQPETYSHRDLDNKSRHGTPVLYLDCSPSEVGWAPVQELDERPDLSALFGVLMLPPNEEGRAFIGLVPYSSENLTEATAMLADVVRRLARSYLAVLSDREIHPLAPVEERHL